MKRNGMCPVCYLKQVLKRPKKLTDIYSVKPYGNGCALTPPMGWSSWNSFKNKINEELIYDTAVAMKEKGLLEAGYNHLNIDDCWHSSLRDANGNIQGDLTTFASGLPNLIKRINALGIKVGLYSSNGTLTCEDLPASLGRERADAYTVAKWGTEYFKYDFCHNIPIPSYAPLVERIIVAPKGSGECREYPCTDALLTGAAKFMPDDKLPSGKHVSGLDRNAGAMEYKNVYVPASGEYSLTVVIRKKGQYEKHLLAIINGEDLYHIPVPPQKIWNNSARMQIIVKLNEGVNTVKLFNPVGSRADSAMLQYLYMGQMLKEASKRVAEESGKPEKPITYSLCEWGRNQPWEWGASAGNLWRTTGDIFARWFRIMMIYEKTVKLYKYAGKGGWNDPDMLEVGNGNLTEDENIAHFSLWCMMSAPLILGNDLREIPDSVLKIVTNKGMIAIDQDGLGKQAKRIKKGKIDILAKPLADGSAAVCLLNKSKTVKSFSFNPSDLVKDGYVQLHLSNCYRFENIWTAEQFEDCGVLKGSLKPHSVAVYKISPYAAE